VLGMWSPLLVMWSPRDVLYVRCLHVPALNLGMLGGSKAAPCLNASHLRPLELRPLNPLDSLPEDVSGEVARDVHNLLYADVAVLMAEFEESLEWVLAEINRMVRPNRTRPSGLDGEESEVDGGKGTAYGALVEAAACADWDELVRLLEDPGKDLQLRPWQRVAPRYPDDKASSALHAAALAGHEAILLYLMYKTALSMEKQATPGDQTFCSTVSSVVKLLPMGAARARADYSFRALVMLRGQHAYTDRLDQLCAAVGAKQSWMDEEEDGMFAACFGDLQVNAELGRAVARELDAWIAACVSQRSVLRGLTASHALVNAIIFCIKSVQHQFDRIDKLARPRLSKASALGARWRAFVQEVERIMGECEGLAGQRLSDLLSWPLQRSMRYKDLMLDLMQGAICCSQGGRDSEIGLSGVTPRQLLKVMTSDRDVVGASAAHASSRPSGRTLALQLLARVQDAPVEAEGGESAAIREIASELLGGLEALWRVMDETMLLNRKVGDLSVRQEAADKAWYYLEGMQGAELILSHHSEFVAHSVATCKLPEGPGSWSQGKTLKLLLLRGTRRQLLLYSEALGVSGITRTCLLKVDLSSVISISEAQVQTEAPTPETPVGRAGEVGAVGAWTETFTMTLKLGANSSAPDECEDGALLTLSFRWPS
jgi:hypothetical protein